jgi:hypothetical protein
MTLLTGARSEADHDVSVVRRAYRSDRLAVIGNVLDRSVSFAAETSTKAIIDAWPDLLRLTPPWLVESGHVFRNANLILQRAEGNLVISPRDVGVEVVKGKNYDGLLHRLQNRQAWKRGARVGHIARGVSDRSAQKDYQFEVTGAGIVTPEDVRQLGSNPVVPTCLALFELKMPVAITSPATVPPMAAIANPLYGWA